MRGARKLDAPYEYLNWVGLSNECWKPSYPFNERSVREAVVRSCTLLRAVSVSIVEES